MGATEAQLRVCEAQGVVPLPPSDGEKLGIALATLDRALLNGMRHRPEGGTSGWYIWGSETMGDEDDFFAPLHHAHMREYCAAALPFLALPPGWRFLVAPGWVDVWFDPMLLEDASG